MTREDIPEPLRGWFGYEFSSGPYTGEDYKKFQNAYARWLRKALPKYKVDVHRNHYEFSAVITRKGGDSGPDRHVYLSISDVRAFPTEWYTRVLMRTMGHAEDWTGGRNRYCSIGYIPKLADELMEEMDREDAA
jgi:hypothetical protein